MCLSLTPDSNTPKLPGAPVMGPLKTHSDLETENNAKEAKGQQRAGFP